MRSPHLDSEEAMTVFSALLRELNGKQHRQMGDTVACQSIFVSYPTLPFAVLGWPDQLLPMKDETVSLSYFFTLL